MRRLISIVSLSVALAALGLVLYNATAVDGRPPSIKSIVLSAPADDERVAQTLTAIDIEFSEPVRTSTVESRFRIEPPIDGAFTWDGSTAIFTPSQKLPSDTEFTIWIEPGVEDLVGNVDEVGLPAWSFRTVGPPVVLRVTPGDGDPAVPLDAVVELVFDRLMDTASVEAAVIVEPAVPVAATWRGSVVTLDFQGALRAGTTYTLSVGAAAADTGGSRLGVPFTTRFATVGAGLRIAATVPADGIAGIGIGTPIAVHFDAPIDPETARAALHIIPSIDGDVRILTLGGDFLSGPAPASSEGADTLIFVPAAALAPHTTYTVTLDPTVARLDDPTIVSQGRTWSFTTGAPTTSGQNQIAFLSARGGIRNVWVMNPDGTNQRQLTVELVPVSSFDTTTDGRELVYAAGGVVTIMAIDGSDVRRLTENDGRLEYAPVLTPNHREFVVARRDPAGTDLGYWLVPLPGVPGDERQLLDHGAPAPGSTGLGGDGIGDTDGTPAWTPRIAFDSSGRLALLVTALGEVAILDVSVPTLGGEPPAGPVAVRLEADAAPVWARGRDAFVLSATEPSGGPSALFTVDVRGRTTRLAGTEGSAGPVGLGPTGALAVLHREPDGLGRLRILATNGSVRDLAGLTGRDDRWPGYSPDGATLVVGRTLAAQPTSSDGIWLLDGLTGLARQLTRDGAYARWIR